LSVNLDARAGREAVVRCESPHGVEISRPSADAGIVPPRIHAPEFPEDAEWLGTPRPLRMAELRGQVVVLDFWTYC
jgi:hypothetical protein